MSKKSLIKFGSLRSIFPDDDFHAQLARLSVLYEDLKIETVGINRKIPVFGSTNDGTYAQRYFIRRAVATLVECGHCITSINGFPEFSNLRQKLGADAITAWDQAIKLLSGKSAKWMIDSLRNDVGGHFGFKPAKRAISSFGAGTIGKIEYLRNQADSGRSIECHFVGEITARAFLKEMNIDPETELTKLMETVTAAHRAVLIATTHLITSYIWPRFGRS